MKSLLASATSLFLAATGAQAQLFEGAQLNFWNWSGATNSVESYNYIGTQAAVALNFGSNFGAQVNLYADRGTYDYGPFCCGLTYYKGKDRSVDFAALARYDATPNLSFGVSLSHNRYSYKDRYSFGGPEFTFEDSLHDITLGGHLLYLTPESEIEAYIRRADTSHITFTDVKGRHDLTDRIELRGRLTLAVDNNTVPINNGYLWASAGGSYEVLPGLQIGADIRRQHSFRDGTENPLYYGILVSYWPNEKTEIFARYFDLDPGGNSHQLTIGLELKLGPKTHPRIFQGL